MKRVDQEDCSGRNQLSLTLANIACPSCDLQQAILMMNHSLPISRTMFGAKISSSSAGLGLLRW